MDIEWREEGRKNKRGSSLEKGWGGEEQREEVVSLEPVNLRFSKVPSCPHIALASFQNQSWAKGFGDGGQVEGFCSAAQGTVHLGVFILRRCIELYTHVHL